jgi:hypothetical protein
MLEDLDEAGRPEHRPAVQAELAQLNSLASDGSLPRTQLLPLGLPNVS